MATASNAGGLPAKQDRPEKEAPPVRAALDQIRDRLSTVLEGRITAEKQIQLVAVMAHSNPKLAECDKSTLQMAVIRASAYGLSLEPSAQEAFLIPRSEKVKLANGREDWRLVCHFQMGYQGVRKLLLRSGEVAALETAVVYERDSFVFRRTGEGVEFYHEPDCFAADRGEIRGVYSLATLRTGVRLVETMSVPEVNKIRDQSLEAMTRRGKDGQPYRPKSPWDDHWGEMARKTVLKRHAKSLPRTEEVDRAIQDDNSIYDRVVGRVLAAIGGDGAKLPAPARGMAALGRRVEALAAPEPTFSASAGVDRPLRSEAEPEDYADAADPGDDYGDAPEPETRRGREPGEDD